MKGRSVPPSPEWITKMIAVVRELVDVASGVYIDYDARFAGGRPADACQYCEWAQAPEDGEYEQTVEGEEHAPDCPVARARVLLAEVTA